MRTTRAQTLDTLPKQPPRRRRRDDPERDRRHRGHREITPARRDRAHAAIDQPAAKRDLPMFGTPAQHLQLDIAELPRSRDEPHPLRQRINNMSSATPARPALARRIPAPT